MAQQVAKAKQRDGHPDVWLRVEKVGQDMAGKVANGTVLEILADEGEHVKVQATSPAMVGWVERYSLQLEGQADESSFGWCLFGSVGCSADTWVGPPLRRAPLVDVKPPDFYIDIKTIFAQVSPPAPGKPAPVRLLDSDWLFARVDKVQAAKNDMERKALALPRRQELEAQHPDAFMAVEMLPSLESCRDTGQVAIGSISHMWLTPFHPDPHGEQLVKIVAALRHAQTRDVYSSVYPRVSQEKMLPHRLAIFYDWASLFQVKKSPVPPFNVVVSRTAAEQEAFISALGVMQLWYAHQKLFAILATTLPEGCNAVGYWSRGWPTVEHLWTMVAKQHNRTTWPSILDVGRANSVAQRVPPLHPDSLDELLLSKTFTSPNADRPMVSRLYRETLVSVLGGAQWLNYGGVGWGDDEIRQLVAVLPLCLQCRRLTLIGNSCGDIGLEAIAAAAADGALPALENLDLTENPPLGDMGARALARALDSMAMPQLNFLNILYGTSVSAVDELSAVCARRGIQLPPGHP